jgi:hypothetical protein
MNWKIIIRDVLIIWVLTSLGGFFVGLGAGAAHIKPPIEAIGLANIICGTIGFGLIGCLTPHNRLKHLLIIGALTWITSVVNVIFFGVIILYWFLGLISILLMLLVGGGLSYLIRKPLPQPGAAANPHPGRISDS